MIYHAFFFSFKINHILIKYETFKSGNFLMTSHRLQQPRFRFYHPLYLLNIKIMRSMLSFQESLTKSSKR